VRRLRLEPLTHDQAEDLTSWRYPAPYGCYDLTGADPDQMAAHGGGFYAVLDGRELIAFRSFGRDGRVSGWDYDDAALDTGGGLRPDLVGQGLGRTVITAGLDFGRAEFAPPAFRVTVASFNTRALRTVESLGFVPLGRFDATRDGRSFDVLLRPELKGPRDPPPPAADAGAT
jgi:ribosomal-protein-alanine N-acetyltransferase